MENVVYIKLYIEHCVLLLGLVDLVIKQIDLRSLDIWKSELLTGYD